MSTDTTADRPEWTHHGDHRTALTATCRCGHTTPACRTWHQVAAAQTEHDLDAHPDRIGAAR